MFLTTNRDFLSERHRFNASGSAPVNLLATPSGNRIVKKRIDNIIRDAMLPIISASPNQTLLKGKKIIGIAMDKNRLTAADTIDQWSWE